MATNFPTAIDDLSTSTGSTGQPLSNPNHITAHTNQNDAIEALQTKVGVDSSVDTDSLDYKVAHVPVSSFSDFDVTAPSSNQIFSYNGTKWVNTLPNIKFGGTGADGALTITSGTTTIDLVGAQFLVKNYTSISITGTGKLAFSNPHANGTTIVLKSQGAVTLTSSQAPMIDASNCGAIGGTAVSGSSQTGNSGSNGISFAMFKTNFGTVGTGGAIPTAINISALSLTLSQLSQKYPYTFVGAGGASGNTSSLPNGSATSGVGGRGGGCLIIECGGAWNFTTAAGIKVGGSNGGNASVSSSLGATSAGGGGGGGGMFIGLYNTSTANTGTVTIAGGSGGLGAKANSGSSATSGGGGASATNAGANGVTNDTPTGGAGGDGLSLVAANTDYN